MKVANQLPLKYELHEGGKINEILFVSEEAAPWRHIKSLLTPQRGKRIMDKLEKSKRSFQTCYDGYPVTG